MELLAWGGRRLSFDILARIIISHSWILLKMHAHLEICIRSTIFLKKGVAQGFDCLSVSHLMLHCVDMQ